MTLIADQNLLDKYLRLAQVLSALLLLLSLLVIFGWAQGNYSLVRLVPDPSFFGFSGAGRQMIMPLAGQVNSTSAICMFTLSACLLLLSFAGGSKAIMLVLRAAAVLVFSACLLGIYNEVTGEDFCSIRLFQPEPSAPGVTFPNPIVVPEAVSVALISLSLFAYTLKTSFRSLGQILTFAACFVPVLIIMGFATGSPQLCALGGCFRLSVGFSLLIIASAATLVLLDRESEFMSLAATRSASGKLLRRAGLLLVSLPVLLLLRALAVSTISSNGHPLIDVGLSWAISGLVFVVLLVWLAYSGALAVKDAETKGAIAVQEAGESSFKQAKICPRCNRESEISKNFCVYCYEQLISIERPAVVGTLFAERYQVEEHLGEGGMARVYKARHTVLDVPVALKILKSDLNNYATHLERFKREGKAASQLTHPAIVKVLDYGVGKHMQPYLALEYIEGETLDSVLEREIQFALSQGVALIAQIAEALVQAHANGIVHRDLKPDNILLLASQAGGPYKVKLVDFGIAWFLQDQSEGQRLTQTGTTIGSPLFMSPEQCRGMDVDERSDIYALGCLSFLILTGCPPIMRDTAADTMIAHVTAEPMEFPESLAIPEPVQKVIYRALSKKVSDRQASVEEFRQSLLEAASVLGT